MHNASFFFCNAIDRCNDSSCEVRSSKESSERSRRRSEVGKVKTLLRRRVTWANLLPTLWVHFMLRIGMEKMLKKWSSSSSQELELIVGARGVLRPPDTLEISAGGPVGLETRRRIWNCRRVEHRHALAVLLVTMASRGEAWGGKESVSVC